MGAAPDRAEELFHEHSQRIYAYCLRQLGSPEDAEDALQATYLNACRSLLSGFEPEIAQAWLFKVAHNVCLTRRRSSWRRARVERPEDIQSIEEFIAAPDKQGEELLGIEDALAGLPDQQRRAILLREWQGLSYREVATQMGLSQGAVETLLFRARRSLAAALEPEEAPERRARFLGLLDGGAMLAALKSSLAGSLGSSLAAGLAVATSTAVMAATPLSNVRAPQQVSAPAAAERHAPQRPKPGVERGDYSAAPVYHGVESAKPGNGKALGHGKQHTPEHAAKKSGKRPRHAEHAGKGDAGPPPHSNAGSGGVSNAGGNGNSQAASKSPK
jgi:RNA polymerase sigma-70 factor (ECF subfamily)